MQFSYTARDKSGKETTGTIEAASKLEAADKLFNEQKLTVIGLEKMANESGEKPTEVKTEVKKTKLHIGRAEEVVQENEEAQTKKVRSVQDAVGWLDNLSVSWTKIEIKDKVVFFRLLAVMINAGLPIVKSLTILAEQTENRRFKIILNEVAETVEGGDSLSNALSEYDDVFSDAEIGIISAGEASGQLNQVLTGLAAEVEKAATLKNKIKSAMIYPVVILAILAIVTVVVMVAVIPKMAELFLGAGVALPLSTRVLISVSNWFVDSTLFVPNWLLFILAIVGAFWGVKVWKATRAGKLVWDQLMLRLPIIGDLQKKIALADFSRQLSTLTASGISIIRALEIASGTVSNEVYKRRILEVKEDVERGIPIHESIEGDKLFPTLVVSMIAVGEQTAQLANVTKKISEFYSEEIDNFVGNLSKIMEPVIIVVVGVLVGGLVAAIMQPIMQIADVASQQ
jgi:type IV pilus assembly protein PilC